MSLKILDYFTKLDENDFLILEAIEQSMKIHSTVKIDEIVKQTDFSQKFVNKKIGNLDKWDILTAHRFEEKYSDTLLTYMGYDALALNVLVKKNILQGIGQSVGIGKESNVFIGNLENNTNCALKFHKIGKTRFKSTRRKRDYFANKNPMTRFEESSLNAKREVFALKKLAGIVPVPHVYGSNRHLIAMEYIEGAELQNILDLDEDTYKFFFEELLSYIKLSLNFNIIHGDLSPFNILIGQKDDTYRITIIDWPQFVELNHPNALDILINDVNNLYLFFSKKTTIQTFDIEKFCLNMLNEAKKNLRIRN